MWKKRLATRGKNERFQNPKILRKFYVFVWVAIELELEVEFLIDFKGGLIPNGLF